MDECYEGVAVPVVCPGRRCRAVQLLHQQREDAARSAARVRDHN